MVKLAPSLLAANPLEIQKCLDAVADADYLHLDIMDGHFVPNLSMGPGFVQACKKGSEVPCDAHLMVERPERFIPAFLEAGSDMITLHVESTPHIHRAVQMVQGAKRKVGLALNPATPLDTLYYLMEDMDLLLIMTVNPGFGGQTFITGLLEKIQKARYMLDKAGSKAMLAVDGGLHAGNVSEVIGAGADFLIAGSAIFQGQGAEGWESFKSAVHP